MPPSVDPNGEFPTLTPEERAGLALYWEEYDAHFDELQAVILPLVSAMPQFAPLLTSQRKDEMAARSQHSRALMATALRDGDWKRYLDDLRERGATYAKLGIEFSAWFELVSRVQETLLPGVIERYGGDPQRLTSIVLASARFMGIAMGVIGEEYLRIKEESNRLQRAAIVELSTPVLQFRERMLVLPVIGVVDSNRARQLTEQLLHAIRKARARVVVMDITGMPIVDTQVANHLVQTVEAARLMGATVIVTGLSPDVARALATLGLDLSKLNTVGDLQGGIEEADRVVGLRGGRVAESETQPAT